MRDQSRQYLLAALLPWPAVFVGLYIFKNVWVAFFLYHAVCLAGWYLGRQSLPPVHKSIHRKVHWLGVLASALTINLAVYLLAASFAVFIDPTHLRLVLQKLHAIGSFDQDIALFLYFLVVNPIVEELFWRRTIYSGLRHCGWSVKRSLAVAGLLFGAWHWLVTNLLFIPALAIAAAIGIAAAGIQLNRLYERRRSVATVILMHALSADLPILIVLWCDVIRH